jgi:transketolase C-terminal domain/subunit
MGNDDCTIFDGMAHLKIVDVSCPRQLRALMQWIMEGNRGLMYVRLMRTPSAVLYGPDYTFEFGKGSVLRETPDEVAVIVSAGRGVHEALAASAECEQAGVRAGVVDMPSIDEDLLISLCRTGKLICLAEQNNGFILQNLLRIAHKRQDVPLRLDRVLAINTLDAAGRPRFIHSGTYEELLTAFDLAPWQIARTIGARLGEDR